MDKFLRELKSSINKIHPIAEDVMDKFVRLWSVKSAHKKTILTEINRTERYLYFVLEGIQKAYFIKDGKERIVAFSHPFSFTCIPESFLTQNPSKYSWECLDDSTFLKISHKDFFCFVSEHPEFETLLWKKLLGTINGLVNRYHRLLACSIEERFKDLMSNSPQLINMVRQKELANYLNMDPSNFSKLINSVRI